MALVWLSVLFSRFYCLHMMRGSVARILIYWAVCSEWPFCSLARQQGCDWNTDAPHKYCDTNLSQGWPAWNYSYSFSACCVLKLLGAVYIYYVIWPRERSSCQNRTLNKSLLSWSETNKYVNWTVKMEICLNICFLRNCFTIFTIFFFKYLSNYLLSESLKTYYFNF